MQCIDLTLADIRDDPGSMKLRRKPVFVYVDFDKIKDRGLLYVIDTPKFWKGEKFNGSLAKIPPQIPRSVTSKQLERLFYSIHNKDEGETGVYVSRSPTYYALRVPCRFCVICQEEEYKRYIGNKGDWVLSDGNVNQYCSHKDIINRFVEKSDNFHRIPQIKPDFKTDEYGIPIMKKYSSSSLEI